MATGTLTTVVDKTIGDVFTEAMYDDYLKDNVNQLIGLRSRNLLVNGGFEVWQRGVSTKSDMWTHEAGAPTAFQAVDRESTIIDGASLYSSRSTVTTYSAPVRAYQRLEDFVQMRGKTLSLSIRVRQSVASQATPVISDSTGTTSGATSVTTGSFVTLTVTRTIAAATTLVEAGVSFSAAGTYYLDNAMLVMGPAPTEYVPLHPQEELARCQRYYEVHGGVSGAMYSGGYNTAGGGAVIPFRFSAPKGGTPTVTKNGTWAVTNCGQPTVAASDAGGYSLQAVVTATGAYSFNCNSTDDTIVAEFNP